MSESEKRKAVKDYEELKAEVATEVVLSEEEIMRRKEEEETAVIKIQSARRGKVTRQETDELRLRKAEDERRYIESIEREEAAVRIQSSVRMKQVQRGVQYDKSWRA